MCGRRHDRTHDQRNAEIALDQRAPMVWTPPSRRGLSRAVSCIEGELSCRLFALAWIWRNMSSRFMASTRMEDGGAQDASPSCRISVLRQPATCLVGMEASNGAHFWAKALSELGHDVRLISAQFVAPYVKSNKNDRNDAEAICEAVSRPSMRFVPVKSAEQLAVQAGHRIRSRLVADRVRLVNQVRGLLGEHGIVVAKDIGNLRRALARIVGDDEDRVLNPLVRALMAELREELTELDARIAGYDRKIRELYRNSEICQRLGKVEGIGPVTATALVAAVGDRSSFKNGRQFAAWLGLVPKQRSSGGRARLFGISKRGDRYLRTLLIHGARSALGRVRDKQDPRSLWLGRMRQRRHPNIVAVALANKNARIAWSGLASDSAYDASLSVGAA
jgi:transposase